VVLSRGAIYADGPPASVQKRAMLADVFDVDLEPNSAPAPDLPYVLPHLARPLGGVGLYPSTIGRSPACISP
jgi:hypothetical protein